MAIFYRLKRYRVSGDIDDVADCHAKNESHYVLLVLLLKWVGLPSRTIYPILGYSSRAISLSPPRRDLAEMAKAKFSPTYTRLRRLLTDSREAAGINQVDLALKLGKPQSYVSKIESGERRLDVVEFVEFARAIGIDPVSLLRKMLAKG
jgi:hypothetical protein